MSIFVLFYLITKLFWSFSTILFRPILLLNCGRFPCMFIHGRPSGSNGTTDIYNQTTCKRMLHKNRQSSRKQSTQSTQSSVALRRPVPPGQPDHMPTRCPVCSRLGSARTSILPARTGVRTAERTTFQCADTFSTLYFY